MSPFMIAKKTNMPSFAGEKTCHEKRTHETENPPKERMFYI